MDSVKILGVRIDNVDMESAVKKCIGFLAEDNCKSIYTPNPEMLIHAQENEEFRMVLLSGDLVVPDGIGVIYASKYLKLGLKERVPGIDLMSRILKHLNYIKGSAYFLGSKKENLELAIENIKEAYPNLQIAGYQDGYYKMEDEVNVLNKINECKPDVLFVGMGFPRQEMLIHKYQKILNVKIAMGVGGSFDVFSKAVSRAPQWMQKIGMEWFYRLLIEPTRIKRMMNIPKFMLRILTIRRSVD